MTPRPAAAPAGYRRKALRATRSAFATTAAAWQSAGRSGNININNNRREVGPLQASAVGPVQTAAPSATGNTLRARQGALVMSCLGHSSGVRATFACPEPYS